MEAYKIFLNKHNVVIQENMDNIQKFKQSSMIDTQIQKTNSSDFTKWNAKTQKFYYKN